MTLLILTREQLEVLSETDLCKRVLIPLFEAMGFRDVRFTGGGSLEQGKDITMWRPELPLDRVTYGVVVKAEPISGKAANQTVVTQVLQCLGSHVVDRETNTERRVDRCWVVTSGTITKEGDYAVQPQLRTLALQEKVRMIDGSELLALLQEHRSIPAILGSMQQQFETIQPDDEHYGIEVGWGPNGKRVLAIAAKTIDAPPLPLSVTLAFPTTEKGLAKLAEYQASIERGTPVELPAEYIENIEFPDIMKALLPEGPTRYALETSPAPSSLRFPCTMTFFNDERELSMSVVLHVERAGVKEMTLSNRGEISGLSVELVAGKGSGTAFACGVNRDYATFEDEEQIVLLDELRAKPSTVVIRFVGGGDILRQQLPPAPRQKSPEYADLVHRVVRLGRTLGISVPLPKREFFSTADIESILYLEQIIATGELPLQSIRFAADAVIPEFRISRPDVTLPLLDVPVPMGDAEITWSDHTLTRAGDGLVTVTMRDGKMRFPRWVPAPAPPRWRPAAEPTCCGSGCEDCPF